MGEKVVEYLADTLPTLEGVKRGVVAMTLIRIGEASVLGRADNSLKASVLEADNAVSVSVGATSYATTAENALGCISYDRGGKLVKSIFRLFCYIVANRQA